mgnify:CR=1 FL=1
MQVTKAVLMSFFILLSGQLHSEQYQKIFNSQDGSVVLIHNTGQLNRLLINDEKQIRVALPLPDGNLINFVLTPTSIMAKELANKYPDIRTFQGVAIDYPNYSGRFDITPHGFHGMFHYQGRRVFVEPEISYVQESTEDKRQKKRRVFKSSPTKYTSYFGRDRGAKNKSTHNYYPAKKITKHVEYSQSAEQTNSASSTIKTYRIAVAAAAEYTLFNGGTVDSAIAEIVTLINRLNLSYQRDLAIKLELVANNDLLVFTDTNTDPFNNDSDDGEINTGIIDDIIGSSNYDIGHVVNTNGGGLAVLGGVCHPSFKGDGVTGSANPTNDAFYIDYVAHEVGHQFGADHTFNGTAGACSGNRVASAAYEVGSGSTIMAYAGICGEQNLQSHSDDFFHAISIEQVNEYVVNGTGSTCGTVTGQNNNAAVVDAGLDYTIPARTPFQLSGSAADIDSVNLAYSWQQFDLGNSSGSLAEQIDDGSRPLFRAYLPSSETTRFFPKLSSVLSSVSNIGEVLPTTNRELNFRLMVVDNEGGVSFDETKLTVVDTGQAFSLSTPEENDVWTASNNTITWDVAQTNETPINCSTVDIQLSKDGGDNFDVTLASKVDNNGSNEISIGSICASDIDTAQARIKVACNNNVFFAVNNGEFSINKALSRADIAIKNQQTFTMTQGESIELTSEQFTYACEDASSIVIQNGENYTFSDGTITPNSDFSGTLLVNIIATKDDISSAIFIASVAVEAIAAPTPTPTPAAETPESSSSGSIFWLLLLILICPWRTGVLTTKNLVTK